MNGATVRAGPLPKDEADVFPAKLKSSAERGSAERGSAERGSAHEEHPALDVHKCVMRLFVLFQTL